MRDRYLRYETITGEWWYKDMETGEDLPMYATPIERKSWQDLNNECSELYQICKQLQKQLQLKETIIKEAREYIKSMKIFDLEEDYDIQKLLEILDKVDKENK